MEIIKFTAKVIGDNYVEIIPEDGFLDNSIYEIKIKGVESINGDKLTANFKLCTRLSPLYVDIQSVKSIIGNSVEVDDDVILYHIREASRFADYIRDIAEEEEIDEDNVPFEVSQFVRYKAAYECLLAHSITLSSASGISGKVGDVSFSEKETNKDITNLLKQLKAEVDKWIDDVRGYQMEGRAKMKYAVKSSRYFRTSYHNNRIHSMPAYEVPNIDFNRGV